MEEKGLVSMDYFIPVIWGVTFYWTYRFLTRYKAI